MFMKKNMRIMMCVVMLTMFLGGCGMEKTNPKDTASEQQDSTTTEQQNDTENDREQVEAQKDSENQEITAGKSDAYMKYETMLNDTTEVENIYQYLDDNALEFGENEADEGIGAFLDAYSANEKIDYERILSNKNLKLSRGMTSYLEAMQEDAKNPAMSDDGVIADQTELLNRSLEMEKIYRDNTDGIVAKYAYDRYNTLLNAALTGNAYGAEGEHSYSNLAGTTVDDKTMKLYEDFVAENPESYTAKLLNNYMDVLKESGNSISDAVTDFYEGMKGTVKDVFGYER